MPLITYPARPVHAGPLDKAPPKHGLWYFEPKVNGWRALVHVPTGQMWNRHGQPLSIEPVFRRAVTKLRSLDIEWADCEALDRRHNWGRGSLVLLDVIEWAGEPYRERHARIRNQCLKGDYPCLDPACLVMRSEQLYFLPAVENHDFAMQLWRDCQRANKLVGAELFEGVVGKRANSRYPIQLISPAREFAFWHKHRHWE